MIYEGFDWKSPDYVSVFRKRVDFLKRLRAEPEALPLIKRHYREAPWDFISDWGITYDPRNVELGLPAVIPFVLFPKQREWVQWTVDHWKNRRPGVTEKSRDMGVSWLSVSTACTLCLFYFGMAVGFGSRKEEYVDRIGAPKSLLFKARMFMENLPVEFRGGWEKDRDAPHMRLNFPEAGSNISGEAGDNIGRGDRTGIYFVDESAFIERPDLIEASLSQTTNCRIDVSSANGPTNAFAIKRHSGKVDVFTFHWRDDPRKSQEWYDKQVADLPAVVVASEIDINYSASVTGVLIPSMWVQAAIGAAEKLGVKATGALTASLDVSDEGEDFNALCGGQGIVVSVLEEWSGVGSDIFKTVQRAFDICDDHGYDLLRYDGDGLGAGVRGDANVINEGRVAKQRPEIEVEAFRGSAAVVDPEDEDVEGRKNEDYFLNANVQAWWSLRVRFQNTYRAIAEGMPFEPDEIISLDPSLKHLPRLIVELSQPTYDKNSIGKLFVEKTPNGTRSPNLADALKIKFARVDDDAALWAKIGKQSRAGRRMGR